MAYKQLFIFIEGDDDERFFKTVVKSFVQEKYSAIRFQKYSRKNKKWKVNFIKSINSMKADYICVGDINNSPCVTSKKEKITSDFDNRITENKIIVVVKEIESWYLAGLDESTSRKLGIRENINTTDTFNKEHFNQLIPNNTPRTVFMREMLENYDVETAKGRNKSFKYFMNKWINNANGV